MSDRVQDALWWAVMWICILFFAFAAGVAAGERKEQNSEPSPVQYEVAMPVMAVSDNNTSGLQEDIRHSKAEEFKGPMLCEDTYLREDLPLDFETQAMLYGACLEFGVEYELALAVIEQETNFKNIMGDGGSAYGYFQIWPKWHSGRMAELGVTDLNDPESNFRVGCHFLRECIDKYGLEKGLGYYNSGKAKVTAYSRSVLEKLEN